MPEVNVDINGRKYRLACEEGQEEHLMGLVAQFNSKIDGFKTHFGEIGDNRLTVMAGIAAFDELAEAKRNIEKLNMDVRKLTLAGQAMHKESEELEARFAKQLSDAARKIEAIATAIDETSAPSTEA